ncbi:circadian clock-controlled protein daywake-like isoform X2 [Periplaneta americana]|uniref:circadian clock-controlled protein daywake-like isoform X2 n=1 Tax=Periplaneta americana TaxID=6978 RepID=UPI0037E7528A
MRALRFVVTVLCFGAVLCYIKEKPEFLKTCWKNDPEFDKCSTRQVQEIFDNIQHGFPSLGMMSLEPLHIPEVKLLQGGDGPVSLNASMVDVKVTGLSKVTIICNKVNFETYGFTTELQIPRLRIEGVYTLNGKILVLPLTGHGDAWLEPEDLDIMAYVDVTRREEDGVQFFKINKVGVQFTIGKLALRLNNLYNGLKTLEDSTNEYLNKNWRPVADSLKPILSRTVSDILLDILSKVFDNIPAKYFLGDLENTPL